MSMLPRRPAPGADEVPGDDAPPPRRAPPRPPIAPAAVKHRGAITVSIMLATIMQALDSTIANVALPHMQGSLSAASDTITWVLTSYIIAAAIMTPMAGWLSGRFGRKQVFLVAVAGFTVASMLCGTAESLAQMVIYRLLQGVFGAALVPLSQSVLLDINPREKHGSAMAIWGAGIMVGPILGPVLGGWLTDAYNWRWVFYINLPVGILAFLGIFAFVPRARGDADRPFDFFGFAMLSLGIGALQMMLDRGELKDWFGSTEIIVEGMLAAIGLYVFLAHSLTAKHPFLHPALFKDRNFIAGLVLIFIVGIILLATLALLPPMLQNLMDYPVITTGLVTAPRGVGTLISMILVGRLVNRTDSRLLMLLGLALTAYSLYEMTSYSMQMGQGPIVWAGIVQGCGLGFIFVPLSTVTFATLPSEYRTEAAGIYSLLRNVGSSLGISVVQTLLTQNTQINHATLAEHITRFNPLMQFPQIVKYWDINTTAGLAALNAEITRQAAMIAYIDDFKLMMIVTLAAIPLLLLVRKPARQPAAAASAAALE
jgi:MFS transporter, DHA2 family, multidrug resistance protein